MNTALKSPAPETNIKLYTHAGWWTFDCWGDLAQSRPQFCPDDEGMSRRNPTDCPSWMDARHVATIIQVHNPLAVFAGDARAAKELRMENGSSIAFTGDAREKIASTNPLMCIDGEQVQPPTTAKEPT